MWTFFFTLILKQVLFEVGVIFQFSSYQTGKSKTKILVLNCPTWLFNGISPPCPFSGISGLIIHNENYILDELY